VARILGLIEDPPRRRNRPLLGDPKGPYSFWFDGGTAIQTTGGGTRYEFADGATARQAPLGLGYPDVYI